MGALSSKSKLEWEVDIPPDLATGDLILFTTQNFGASCIRCWTQHHYDHVAMVVALPDGLRTIEAVTDGVGCWKLPERVTEGVFGTVAVRRLMVDLTDDMIRNLNVFLQEAKHKKYRQPVHRWAKMICCGKEPVDPANLRSRRAIPNEPGYFCSSFVAACYMAMGLLPKDPSCESYFPCDFAQNSKFLEPLLKKNAFLSEEIEIRYLRRFPIPPTLKDITSPALEKPVEESNVRVEMTTNGSKQDSQSAEIQPPVFHPEVIHEEEKKPEPHAATAQAQPIHVSSFFSISPPTSPQHNKDAAANAPSLSTAISQAAPTAAAPSLTVDTNAQTLAGQVFVSVLMTPDSKDPAAVETAHIDLDLMAQEAASQSVAASPHNQNEVVISFSPSVSPANHPKDEPPSELTTSRSLPQIFFPLAQKSPRPPLRAQTPHHAWLSFPRGVPPSASAVEVRRFQRPNVPVVVPEGFQRISKDQSQFRISEAMQKRQAITSSKTHDTIVWRGHADIRINSPSSVNSVRHIPPTTQTIL